jgi:hypothetical protein
MREQSLVGQIHDEFGLDNLGSKLLNSLAGGVYEPQEVIREYVQNAVDAHRIVRDETGFAPEEPIHIEFRGGDGSLSFLDYGIGMDEDEIKKVKSIAVSDKSLRDASLTGYKGVGIWAGYSFFDKFTLYTTKKGVPFGYEMTIDFKAIRESISHENSLAEALKEKHTIYKYEEDVDEHRTTATLHSPSENAEFFGDPDSVIDAVRRTCPCRLDPTFDHSDEVEEWYTENGFEFFSILAGGEEVFRSCPSNVREPEFGEIRVGETVVAKYWQALTDSKGVLSPDEHQMVGFQILQKGFIIGQENIYSEDTLLGYEDIRTQAYLRWQVGEIHVVSDEIKPKLQRDEFESTQFAKEFIRELRRKYTDFAHSARVVSHLNKREKSYAFYDKTVRRAEKTIESDKELPEDLEAALIDARIELKNDEDIFHEYYNRPVRKPKVLAVREVKTKRRQLLTRLDKLIQEENLDVDEQPDDSNGRSDDNLPPELFGDDEQVYPSSEETEPSQDNGSEQVSSDQHSAMQLELDGKTHQVYPVPLDFLLGVVQNVMNEVFQQDENKVEEAVTAIRNRIKELISDA